MFPKIISSHSEDVSEVEKRFEYFQLLEKELPNHSLVTTIKDCLHNDPKRRPTAVQLLERIIAISDRQHGDLARINATRQVLAAKDFAELEQRLKV